MKGLKIGAYLVGMMLVGVGVAMAVTNPSQAAYEDYATEQLTQYLKDNACTQAPNVLGNVLQEQCGALLDNNQTEVRRFIASNTERQNFIILSVYKTDLAIAPLGSLVPSYEFETLGVFQRFYIYKALKR